MDYLRAVDELLERKKQLDQAIATLEALVSGAPTSKPTRKRGRKSMSSEERRVVSARMSQYWASRRKNGSA